MKSYTEKYSLCENILPALPCPHDYVIKEIHLENDYLIFIFEDDVSYHDNARENIKTLQIKYHLIYKDMLCAYRKKYKHKVLHKNGYFEEIAINKILGVQRTETAYLYHFLRYNEIIIQLALPDELILNFETDIIEYEWFEKD